MAEMTEAQSEAISIHALLAESDLRACPVWSPRPYFYPRSPCGERRYTVHHSGRSSYFYPRSPCGERHYCCSYTPHSQRFLSTLSLRRATRYAVNLHPETGISIHALLAESDHLGVRIHFLPSIFLSTLSLRRATASLT